MGTLWNFVPATPGRARDGREEARIEVLAQFKPPVLWEQRLVNRSVLYTFYHRGGS